MIKQDLRMARKQTPQQTNQVYLMAIDKGDQTILRSVPLVTDICVICLKGHAPQNSLITLIDNYQIYLICLLRSLTIRDLSGGSANRVCIQVSCTILLHSLPQFASVSANS